MKMRKPHVFLLALPAIAAADSLVIKIRGAK